MKAYFADNSYEGVQTSFQRKFQCCHALSKCIIFDWIQKFRDYGTVQNLNSKAITAIISEIPEEE